MTLVLNGEVRVGFPSDRLPDGVELTTALETACGAPEGTIRVTSVRQLKTNVYRVGCSRFPDEREHSYVLKSCNPGLARHNQLVARRWLPQIGLSALADVDIADYHLA